MVEHNPAQPPHNSAEKPSKRQTRRSYRRSGRALRLDFFRELKKSHARFISLLTIVALGVAFYTGIRAAAPGMRATADNYFDEQQLMDLRIVSTLGLRAEDAQRLATLDSVDLVMPAHSADVFLDLGANTQVVRIHDIPEENGDALNQIVLVEGTWPTQPNEVLVEHTMLNETDYRIGDTIQLQLPEDSIFTETELTITGTAESPYYISLEREPTTLGTGTLTYFFYTLPSAFDADYYTEIFLTVHGARAYSTYSDAYSTLIESSINEIDAILPGLIAERRQDLVKVAESELAPHVHDLETARQEAATEFAKARQELDDAYRELNTARTDLQQGEAMLAEMNSNLEQLTAAGMVDEAAMLSAQIAALDEQLAGAREAILDAELELVTGENDLTEAIATADTEFADAEAEIEEARQSIRDIPEGEGLILDRDTNIGVITYGQNADRIEAIGKVFPAIFFLVAAFISLTSMSRMVEDERAQIGTMKALGYTNWQTFRKYFFFALLASLIGGLIGGFFGLYFFPYIIIDAYGMLYSIPEYIILIYPDLIFFGVIIASLSTLGGVVLSGVPAVRLNPASLMRPPAPKPGKRIWLETVKPIWKRMSFSYKVSMRNMFRFKKRLFMTLFGIGGCTALLLTGFGLRDSISAIVGDQFSNIFLYDLSIQIDGSDASVIPAIQEHLDEDSQLLKSYSQDVTILAKNADLDLPLRELTFTSGVSILVAEDPSSFETMYRLTTPRRGEALSLPDDAIIITVKLAERLGVKVGDEISVQRFQGVSGSAVSSGDDRVVFTEPLTLTVGGIAENYLGHYVFMSQDYLKQVDGADLSALQWNTLFVQSESLQDPDVADALAVDLLREDGVNQLTLIEDSSRTFALSMEQLDGVIVIIIIAAGLLAVAVLYNLNNINISERRREIATLKVLGFNRRELANYIYRENIFLMFIGIALGLIGGIFLHRFIITTVEVDLTRFGREIKPLSWIYSILLTIAFSLGVNLGMYNKIQNTDMVESLKSVE